MAMESDKVAVIKIFQRKLESSELVIPGKE
jgi:hypothetical protein